MPPPPRRGRGGSRRGSGTGRSLGMSPGPRRKDDDKTWKTIKEEEEGEDDGLNSPPRTASTVMADDEASSVNTSPSKSLPKSHRRNSTDMSMEMSDLQRSYDFAVDEEKRTRLREEMQKLREEEEEQRLLELEEAQNNINNERRNQEKIASPVPGRKMVEDKPKMVLTFIGRTGGVKNIKKSLKDLMKASKSVLPSSGTTYSICEKYDTYQKGGLFPIFHVSEDSGTINKILNTENGVDPNALGPENTVDQGVFEEVACITPPLNNGGATNTVLAVSAFKSIDPSPNAKLVKEWKQWTGARAFLQDIAMAGLECQKIRFMVKISPSEEANGFYYVLFTEVGIREPRDEGLFVDTLQRFRVERWFGYNTIYRKQ